MTVEEIINRLTTFPKDSKVVVQILGENGYVQGREIIQVYDDNGVVGIYGVTGKDDH